jgi:hypothetical protein
MFVQAFDFSALYATITREKKRDWLKEIILL